MPTAKVTKNVSAAIGGGNVLCSTLISIKTKAWLYSFGCAVSFFTAVHSCEKHPAFLSDPVSAFPYSHFSLPLFLMWIQQPPSAVCSVLAPFGLE